MNKKNVQRGDIWYADLPMVTGSSIQGGTRPVLVYQTDTMNDRSPTVNVLAVTSQLKRMDLRYHVELPRIAGLPKKSMVLAEQAFTLDQSRLFDFRCRVPETVMKQVERARRMITRKAGGHRQARHRRKRRNYSGNEMLKARAVAKKKE